MLNQFVKARNFMLKSQLMTNNVTNRNILRAFADVPREVFVPDYLENSAYIDEDITLDDNLYLIEPMAFAKMLEFAKITFTPEEKEDDNKGENQLSDYSKSKQSILSIYNYPGYSLAIFARLFDKVIGVEPKSCSIAEITRKLDKLGLSADIKSQEHILQGYRENAPYDYIFVNGMINIQPYGLYEQLKEGGSVIMVINNDNSNVGRICKATKNDNQIDIKYGDDVFISELPSFNDASDKIFYL